jgi:hypothetical protein
MPTDILNDRYKHVSSEEQFSDSSCNMGEVHKSKLELNLTFKWQILIIPSLHHSLLLQVHKSLEEFGTLINNAYQLTHYNIPTEMSKYNRHLNIQDLAIKYKAHYCNLQILTKRNIITLQQIFNFMHQNTNAFSSTAPNTYSGRSISYQKWIKPKMVNIFVIYTEH